MWRNYGDSDLAEYGGILVKREHENSYSFFKVDVDYNNHKYAYQGIINNVEKYVDSPALKKTVLRLDYENAAAFIEEDPEYAAAEIAKSIHAAYSTEAYKTASEFQISNYKNEYLEDSYLEDWAFDVTNNQLIDFMERLEIPSNYLPEYEFNFQEVSFDDVSYSKQGAEEFFSVKDLTFLSPSNQQERALYSAFTASNVMSSLEINDEVLSFEKFKELMRNDKLQVKLNADVTISPDYKETNTFTLCAYYEDKKVENVVCDLNAKEQKSLDEFLHSDEVKRNFKASKDTYTEERLQEEKNKWKAFGSVTDFNGIVVGQDTIDKNKYEFFQLQTDDNNDKYAYYGVVKNIDEYYNEDTAFESIMSELGYRFTEDFIKSNPEIAVAKLIETYGAAEFGAKNIFGNGSYSFDKNLFKASDSQIVNFMSKLEIPADFIPEPKIEFEFDSLNNFHWEDLLLSENGGFVSDFVFKGKGDFSSQELEYRYMFEAFRRTDLKQYLQKEVKGFNAEIKNANDCYDLRNSDANFEFVLSVKRDSNSNNSLSVRAICDFPSFDTKEFKVPLSDKEQKSLDKLVEKEYPNIVGEKPEYLKSI